MLPGKCKKGNLEPKRFRGRNGALARRGLFFGIWTLSRSKSSFPLVQRALLISNATNSHIRSAMIGNRAVFDAHRKDSADSEPSPHTVFVDSGYHLLRDKQFPRPETVYDVIDERLPRVVTEQSDTIITAGDGPFAIDVESRLPYRSISLPAHLLGTGDMCCKLDVERIVMIQVGQPALVLCLRCAKLTRCFLCRTSVTRERSYENTHFDSRNAEDTKGYVVLVLD